MSRGERHESDVEAVSFHMSDLKRKRPRRSKGCDACKARRMKCSGTRPKPCQECLKRGNGKECVYQINTIIFQSENAFVERSVKTSQRRKASSTISTSNETTPIQSRNGTSPASSPDDGHKAVDIFALESGSWQDRSLDATIMGHLDSDRWASSDSSPPCRLADPETRALSAFFSEYLPCEVVLSLHEHWVQLLKPALHDVPVLRNIVLAISRINVGSKYTDYWDARDNRMKAMEHYNIAVRQLQRSLEDPRASMTDTVLYAVNLLGVYELCKGTSTESLQQHTDGGLSLIRARGAAAHAKPGLSANIAAAFQGNELRRSIESGKKTFFAEPDWLAASRAWTPLAWNKWAGTELNVLMLRACNVLATDGYDLEAARIILAEIHVERASCLRRREDVLSSVLEMQSIKARSLGLHRSPFGPHSVSYDLLKTGDYMSTLFAITSAWILLTLFLSYPELLPSPDFGHQIMTDMIRCIQYIIHDCKNHTGPMFYEIMSPLIDAIHWAKSEDETNWIIHLLSTTGAPVMKQIGQLAKTRVKQGFESAKMKELRMPVAGFLKEIGISESATTMTDDFEDDGRGYRSGICA